MQRKKDITPKSAPYQISMNLFYNQSSLLSPSVTKKRN